MGVTSGSSGQVWVFGGFALLNKRCLAEKCTSELLTLSSCCGPWAEKVTERTICGTADVCPTVPRKCGFGFVGSGDIHGEMLEMGQRDPAPKQLQLLCLCSQRAPEPHI